MDATLSQLLESIALTPTGDLQSLSGGISLPYTAWRRARGRW